MKKYGCEVRRARSELYYTQKRMGQLEERDKLQTASIHIMRQTIKQQTACLVQLNQRLATVERALECQRTASELFFSY